MAEVSWTPAAPPGGMTVTGVCGAGRGVTATRRWFAGSDGDSEAYDFQAPRGGNDRSQGARGSHGWGGIAGSPGTLVRSQVLQV